MIWGALQQFEAYCDAMGGIEALLDYTEKMLDCMCKEVFGLENGEWVAPHLSEPAPRTRAGAHALIEARAEECSRVYTEIYNCSWA
jgi:hypothetical protein